MLGIYSTIFTFLLTSILFILSKDFNNLDNLLKLLTQFISLMAIAAVSLNYMLSVRTKWIENIFGGFDTVYKVHNVLGNIGFIFVCLHPMLLIVDAFPYNLTKNYLVLNFNNIPYSYGILSFYFLVLFVSLTIFVKLPYKFWKKTHEFIILVLIFAFLHSITITSDISVFLPLKIWVIFLCILGFIAYLYKRFLYYYISPKNNYKVTNIKIDKDYLLLELENTKINNLLLFKPGQCAFISNNQDIRNEHPFSVVDFSENKVTFGIKIIGEFTKWLSNLKINDLVNVKGPFGFFSDSIKENSNIVFISAGVGITPFYSMAKSITSYQNVTMVHSCKTTDSKVFNNYFLNLNMPNFKFVEHNSDISGRLNIEIIKKYIGNIKEFTFYICGPEQFMQTVYDQLILEGVKRRNIKYEDFDFK